MKDMTLTQEYLVCAVNEKGKIGSMNIEKVVCPPPAGRGKAPGRDELYRKIRPADGAANRPAAL